MHAMQTIANEGQTPMAKQDAPSHAHIHAHELLAVFSDTSVEAKRMATVWKLSCGDTRLTQEQLEQELQEAAKLADEVDKRNGFQSTKEVRYGPKRSCLNTVSSMIRQVWGALTYCGIGNNVTADGVALTPKVTANTAFAQAVSVCRKALKEQGIKWDGRKLPSPEEKKQRADTALLLQQQAEYAEQFPMTAGETIADFQKRQALACEIRLGDAKEKATEATIKTMADKLWKEMGPELCAMLADTLYERFDAHAAVHQGKPDTNEESETE